MTDTRLKRLGKPKIYYDPQVKMWVVIDKDSHVATQAETKGLLQEVFIDALRCMCASLWEEIDRRVVKCEGKKRKPR